MNVLKFVAIAIVMLISVSAYSEERVVLTQDEVCKIFLSDAVNLGLLYIREDKAFAAQWLIIRAQEEPLHYVFLPGNLHIIESMDAAKIQNEENVVDFSVAVYNVCMKELHVIPNKWLQEIPGAMIMREGDAPSLLEKESPKVMM